MFTMADPEINGEERAVFAHHVQALLRRQQKDDRDAIGATLGRARFQVQGADGQTASPTRRGGKAQAHERVVGFFTASPLTGRGRQSGGFRVPHFDMKPITRTYAPTSAGGHVRRGHEGAAMTAAAHFDYVTNGAKIGIGTHIDYIRRETGLQDPADDLVLDMLDEQDLRNEKNRLAIFSNIPGGLTRQRSLFEAAERYESLPRTHQLMASTASVEGFVMFERMGTAPGWLRAMTRRLREKRDELERKAAKARKTFRHREVAVADVTEQEAYERLAWLDQPPAILGLFRWKQGRTGRVQHRFVGELPDGLSARDRHEILTRFCGTLDADGWMVVGAIHQPDQHNDRRNFHIHVDGYDRPARWLDKEGKWDFDYTERRNGKLVRPFAQNKVRYDAAIGTDSSGKPNIAAMMRHRFITIVNEVVGDQPDIVRYLHGTYADNNVALTPLEHMGNRAAGLERRGTVTEVGSRNARKIVADEAAACEARATAAEAALSHELALTRSILAQNRDALTALEVYEALERRLIRRRLQAELADVVVAMARSRADAVIRELTPEPGRPIKAKAGDADLLAGARDHLAEVERHSPSQAERDAERRELARTQTRANAEWNIVQAATGQSPQDRAHEPVMEYRARDRAQAPPATAPSRYDDQKRNRLSAWLEKHASDPALILIEGDEIRLGRSAPLAIDTLMRQFAGSRPVQQLLLPERVRRQADIAKRVRKKQPVETISTTASPIMIPVVEWGVQLFVPEPTLEGAISSSGQAPIWLADESSVNDVPPSPGPHLPDRPAVEITTAREEAKIARRKILAEAGRSRNEASLNEAWAHLIRKRAAITLDGGRYAIDLTGLSDPERLALMRPDYDKELQSRLRELHAKQERERPVLPPHVVSPAARKAWAAMAARHQDVFPSGPPAQMRAAVGLRSAKRLANAPTLRAARAMVPEAIAGITPRDLLETHQAGSVADVTTAKPNRPRHIGDVSTIEKQAQTLAPFPGKEKAKGRLEQVVFDPRGKGPQER